MRRHVTMTLPDQLIADLKAAAHSQNTSMSEIVTTAVAAHLNATVPPKAKPGPRPVEMTRNQRTVYEAIIADPQRASDEIEIRERTGMSLNMVKRACFELSRMEKLISINTNRVERGNRIYVVPIWEAWAGIPGKKP